MRPTSIPLLIVAWLVAAILAGGFVHLIASRGGQVPVAGYLTGPLLLAVAAIVLAWGIPLRRYMRESEERRLRPTLAPRRTQLDMTTAFRIVMLARAAVWTGALASGFFGGDTVYLVFHGGSLLSAVIPTGFATLCAIVLAVVGIIVERWGTLPPQSGTGPLEGAAEGGTTRPRCPEHPPE